MASDDANNNNNNNNNNDGNPLRDREQDSQSQPGIARPGQQPDQRQIPGAPPQPDSRQQTGSNQWIAPTTGNPDLDPIHQHGPQGGLQPSTNPLTPQGMLFDPNQMLDWQRQGRSSGAVPPGARFDPFGPPDPSTVGPGRGPLPDSQFGVPDPDHFQPPGQPQPPPLGSAKSLKYPWPPGPRGPGGSGGFPPPSGAGGSPFL